MDRRLLFPAIAATAWAQQPSQPAAEALRDRVQQYYQLMLDKKYRQAEAMVADDSKEDYYAGRKPDLRGFDILSLDMQSATIAQVTIRAKVLVLMPGAGAQIFDMPTPTYWKIENGVWCWYIPAEARSATPFGSMNNNSSANGGLSMKGAAPGGIENPNVGMLVSQITIDKTSVSLTSKDSSQVATITNGLPGPINLILDPHLENVKAIKVDVEPLHLEAGGKAAIRIRRLTPGTVIDTISVTAEPFHKVFQIQLRSE